MTAFLNPPLAARNGHALRVLAICRISTIHQDRRSLEDQEAYYRDWLSRYTDLNVEMEVIASRGSGECIDRAEYHRAIERVESGEFDLVISEDVGRICRRVHAHIFCETCEDHDTRLIAINDQVDTGRDDWRMSSFFAVMRHEAYNRDTALRIRRSQRNRFNSGGVFPCELYGYIKPAGTSHEADVRKDPDAEPIYDEWFDLLEAGATFAEVADWLNDRGIKPGPYARSEKWDGTMVGRVTRNPILKGQRVRNDRMSRRVNSSGRRKSVKAPPEERLTRDCPHLRFIEPERYDRVIRLLEERNRGYARNGKDGHDPRANVPKKRTRFPGQSVLCGVCGRLYVYGGHGQKDHLMCQGAREHKCWNGITFDGPEACRRLTQAIYDQIEGLPAFDSDFLELVQHEIEQRDSRRAIELRDWDAKRQKNQREIDNVVTSLRQHGFSEILSEQLRRLECQKNELDQRRAEFQQRPRAEIVIPTVEEIKRVAREEFGRLAADSPEFARLMRQLLSSIHVFPYRLCDRGHVMLRASVTFTATPWIPQAAAELRGLRERLTGHFRVDLFANPQREQFREEVMQMRSVGQREAEVAAALGITKTAAQRAAALQRRMHSLGIDDPWLPVLEPPTDYAKLRRHLHKRYAFEPLDGYPLAWPS